MKRAFVRTQNVKNFVSMIGRIYSRAEGVPGMALVYGEPGLGKTKTAIWWAAKNDAVLIRCTNMMTGRWLLRELVSELGEVPYHYSSDLFNQCIDLLNEDPKTIIVDEIDYLADDTGAIETLRDIHDKTGVPLIMIGMGMADKKLMKYRHLYDRLSEIVQFKSFEFEDVKLIMKELSEVKISECGIKYIFSKTKRFRQIVKFIAKAESVALANGLENINANILKEIIKNAEEEDSQNSKEPAKIRA